jgi:hypothetical protein
MRCSWKVTSSIAPKTGNSGGGVTRAKQKGIQNRDGSCTCERLSRRTRRRRERTHHCVPSQAWRAMSRILSSQQKTTLVTPGHEHRRIGRLLSPCRLCMYTCNASMLTSAMFHLGEFEASGGNSVSSLIRGNNKLYQLEYISSTYLHSFSNATDGCRPSLFLHQDSLSA